MFTNTAGYAAGDSGRIIMSTDNGVTWTPMISGTTENLNAIQFSTDSTGWVVGDNGVIRTLQPVPTGMQNVLAENSGLNVFPNPVADGTFSLTFKTPSCESFELFIYDAQGKLLARTRHAVQQSGAEQTLSGLSLPEVGVYLLKIQAGETVLKKRIVRK